MNSEFKFNLTKTESPLQFLVKEGKSQLQEKRRLAKEIKDRQINEMQQNSLSLVLRK